MSTGRAAYTNVTINYNTLETYISKRSNKIDIINSIDFILT